MQNQVLVINSGSSSIKFSLIAVETNSVICSGLAEKLGINGACIHTNFGNQKETEMLPDGDHETAMQYIFRFLKKKFT